MRPLSPSTSPAPSRGPSRGPRGRRAEREQLGAVGPGFEGAHGARRHTQGVPDPEPHDLVVELRAKAATQEHVELLLLLVPVPPWDAEARSQTLVADARAFECKRLAREAGLEIRCEPELGRLVLDLFHVDDRVRGH